MLTINGDDFEVYETDSFETVKDRISYIYQAPWKYLKFIPEINDMEDLQDNLVMDNLLDLILNQDDVYFPDQLIQKVVTDFPKLNLDKDVEELYVAFNTSFQDAKSLLAAHNFSIDPKAAWENRDKIKADFNKQLEILKVKVANHDRLTSQLLAIKPLDYTPFVYEGSTFLEDFGPQDKTIEEIFDSLVTNDYVPYISMNNIYKVKDDFTPYIGWVNEYGKGYIFMKVNNEKEENLRTLKDVYKKYSDAVFTIQDGSLISTLAIDLTKRSVDREQFHDRTLSVFPKDSIPTLNNYRETNTTGVFYFPYQSFDTTVWSDLVMNNNLFNDLFVVDESMRMSKIKQNIFMRSLNGSETIYMQMTTGSKDEIPAGMLTSDMYTRVRIKKTTNINRINNLQNILARLMTKYNEDYNSVVDYYRFYVPSFSPAPLLNVYSGPPLEGRSLRSIAPKIFLPSYSRKCPDFPTIISDEEAAQTDKEVMRFPIFGEDIERNYICNPSPNKPNNIYPGLMINKGDNSKEFPFIPCCYAKDPKSNPSSNYYTYINRRNLREVAPSQDFYKTRRLLPVNKFGFLPVKISDLFNTVITPDSEMLRVGTRSLDLSFIEAILTAKGIITGLESNLSSILADELRSLLTPEFAASAKQELYTKTIDEILDIMSVGDLRAPWFINTLEIKYDCTIFLFTEQDGGTLMVPNHTMGYYKSLPIKDTIFILYHYGSVDINGKKLPKCELIVRAPRLEPQQYGSLERRSCEYMFRKDSPVVSTISNLFFRLIEKYHFSEKVEPTYFVELPIKFQYIDVYGKCRMLCLEHEGTNVTLLIRPAPPFVAPVNNKIFRAPLPVIVKIIVKYGLKVINQMKSLTTKNTREINVSIGTHKGTFLTDDKGSLKSFKVIQGENYGMIDEEGISPLKEMETLSKTARVLTQNAIYLCSKYIGTSKLTKDLLQNFIENKISLNNQVDYDIDQMRPFFNDSTNHMIKDGMLIVPSIEILKRIIYYIRFFYKINRETFESYKTMEDIPEFYDNIADYKSHLGEYLLYEKKGIENLLKTKASAPNLIATYIIKPTLDAYFYKNSTLGDRVFIAQNAHTYFHANYIVVEWRTNRINPGTNFALPDQSAIPSEQEESVSSTESNLSIFDLNIEDIIGPEFIPQQMVTDVPKSIDGETPILPPTKFVDFTIYKYTSDAQIKLFKEYPNTKEIVLADVLPSGVVKYTVLLTL